MGQDIRTQRNKLKTFVLNGNIVCIIILYIQYLVQYYNLYTLYPNINGQNYVKIICFFRFLLIYV